MFYVAMNCFRMVEGYVDNANAPGGAAAYIANLAPWHHVFKDTLYATQEIFGDFVAVRADHEPLTARPILIVSNPDLSLLHHLGQKLESHHRAKHPIHSKP